MFFFNLQVPKFNFSAPWHIYFFMSVSNVTSLSHHLIFLGQRRPKAMTSNALLLTPVIYTYFVTPLCGLRGIAHMLSC